MTLTARTDNAFVPDATVSKRGLTGVHRYQVVCCVVALLSCIPYLWVLWDLWERDHQPLQGDSGLPRPHLRRSGSGHHARPSLAATWQHRRGRRSWPTVTSTPTSASFPHF